MEKKATAADGGSKGGVPEVSEKGQRRAVGARAKEGSESSSSGKVSFSRPFARNSALKTGSGQELEGYSRSDSCSDWAR